MVNDLKVLSISSVELMVNMVRLIRNYYARTKGIMFINVVFFLRISLFIPLWRCAIILQLLDDFGLAQSASETRAVEASILTLTNNSEGFPLIYSTGQSDLDEAIVIQKLGCNLASVHNGSPFSLHQVLLLADQMISRLETLHGLGYVHGQVKPSVFFFQLAAMTNCTEGPSSLRQRQQIPSTLLLSDFGAARLWEPNSLVIDEYKKPTRSSLIANNEDEEHVVPYAELDFEPLFSSSCHGPGPFTQLTFASFNILCGIAPTRRDDMESLGYTLLALLKPLPWDDYSKACPTNHSADAEGGSEGGIRRWMVAERAKVSMYALCRDLPGPFLEYFRHVKALGYFEKPDYSYLRKLFSDLWRKDA